MQTSTERFDVVVVGGGQAGLAMGYHLAKRNINFVILDAHSRVGDAWRLRWDSLRLFTPARIDGLPGMPFPGPSTALPGKDEVAGYLEAYASHFKLPIRLATTVDFATKDGDRFVVAAGDRRFEADQLIVATGGHPEPVRPDFAAQLDRGIFQLHSADYRNPSQFRDGDVLVVGAANSGAEVALGAAADHRTWLAGRSTGTFSSTIYRRPLWWMITRVATVKTGAGRKLKAQAEVGGSKLFQPRLKELAAAGVIRVPRVAGVQDGKPRLEDGRVLDVRNVVWCTGFQHDYGWIRLPGFRDAHTPPHDRGIVGAIPGLYFVGLPYQLAINSALLDGVGRDAEYVARHVVARASARSEPPQSSSEARRVAPR